MIERLMRWMGVAPVAPALPYTVELFKQGYSIPQIAAWAGASGASMVPGQRAIEDELRQYISLLEQTIEAMRQHG